MTLALCMVSLKLFPSIIFPKQVLPHPLPDGNIFNELLKDNFVYYLSALINKDKLLKIPRIPENLTQVEDYYIFLHLAKLHRVVAVQEVCCSYRLHDSNLVEKPIEGAKESLELIKSFYQILEHRTL